MSIIILKNQLKDLKWSILFELDKIHQKANGLMIFSTNLGLNQLDFELID